MPVLTSSVLSTSTARAHASFLACLRTALAGLGYGDAPLDGLLHASPAEALFRARLASFAQALGCRIDIVTPEAQAGLVWNTHPEPGDLSDAQVLFLCRLKQAVLQGKAVIVRTRPLWSRLLGWTDNLALLPSEVGGCEGSRTLYGCVSVEKPYESDCAVIIAPRSPIATPLRRPIP
jgi:hypothetical protein